MSQRNAQLALNFIVGLLIVEIPTVMEFLTRDPQPDARWLAAGLLGGLLGLLKRYVETSPDNLRALHEETYSKVAPPSAMLDSSAAGSRVQS